MFSQVEAGEATIGAEDHAGAGEEQEGGVPAEEGTVGTSLVR
jgi:hypothetical protein